MIPTHLLPECRRCARRPTTKCSAALPQPGLRPSRRYPPAPDGRRIFLASCCVPLLQRGRRTPEELNTVAGSPSRRTLRRNGCPSRQGHNVREPSPGQQWIAGRPP
jgi:hypothetical protein